MLISSKIIRRRLKWVALLIFGVLDVRLSRKEQRVYDFLLKCKKEGRSVTVGDVCRECRTTPLTLLGKTLPAIRVKRPGLDVNYVPGR
ncbi:hypothetical protein [Anaeroselena agilis]|uniref:Uncharacterized protein n=1 Tax=Anaeroselena agilis TaxID=3063788 RepID=A0ABU3NZH6_9FIRM|nr:hypothetical protein [Selenomonadales bacterium 4137-cl]